MFTPPCARRTKFICGWLPRRTFQDESGSFITSASVVSRARSHQPAARPQLGEHRALRP